MSPTSVSERSAKKYLCKNLHISEKALSLIYQSKANGSGRRTIQKNKVAKRIMKQTTLHFHIGRGGQFYNPGYRTFKGTNSLQDVLVARSSEVFTFGSYIGDSSGHHLLTHEEGKQPTGRIEWDNDYDTDEVIFLHEATGADMQIVRKSGDCEAERLIREWVELKLEGQPMEWDRIDSDDYGDIIDMIADSLPLDISDFYQPIEEE